MVTIRDIARQSGYSVSTVSRVLNQHPHVSQEARLAIEQLVKDLDYTPNLLAKELSLGKTHKVGVVIPHTRHPYFTQLLNGLLDAAQESQHQLVLLPSQYDQTLEISYLEQLRGQAFDSLIFTSRSLSLESILPYSKYGSIVCCEKVEHPQISSVYVKRKPAYLELYRHLQNKGHQHIAILLSRSSLDSSTYRHSMESFQEVYGQEQEPLILEGIFNYEDAYQAAQQLAREDKLDAIVANGDEVAAGIARYYQENQRLLPYLIGQENQVASQLLHIPTIDNKSYQLGQEAFQQALADQVTSKTLYSTLLLR